MPASTNAATGMDSKAEVTRLHSFQHPRWRDEEGISHSRILERALFRRRGYPAQRYTDIPCMQLSVTRDNTVKRSGQTVFSVVCRLRNDAMSSGGKTA